LTAAPCGRARFDPSLACFRHPVFKPISARNEMQTSILMHFAFRRLNEIDAELLVEESTKKTSHFNEGRD
jgi:hypothetical protein